LNEISKKIGIINKLKNMNEYEKQKNVGRIENRDSTYSKEYLVCLEKD
jgi:hypothetical protein